MLELIVLGQVPGTNVYISFYFVLVGLVVSAIACAAGLLFIKKHFDHLEKKHDDIEDQAI